MTAENQTTLPEPAQPSTFASRRQFVQLGIAAVAAAWLGILVQNRLFPAQSGAQEVKPVIFPLSDLPDGGTKSLLYGGSPVLALRTPESIRAFSLICTHLGCIVQWQPGKSEFYCPCHDGRFDQFGEVIAGPPPVPLEEIPVSVANEQVTVGEVL